MNKINQISSLVICTVLMTPYSYASDGFFDWMSSTKRMKGIEAIDDKVYNEECGACHFAYQPGLLPQASWKKLIDPKALEDHFGDNAELDAETHKHIETILLDKAADKSHYKRSRKIMASLDKDSAPLRISEIPYIIEKHDELSSKHIKDNPQVKSLSACAKCHQNAEQGEFDEDNVRIPGFKQWDD